MTDYDCSYNLDWSIVSVSSAGSHAVVLARNDESERKKKARKILEKISSPRCAKDMIKEESITVPCMSPKKEPSSWHGHARRPWSHN